MVAAMAMQWTVARAVANGIFKDRLAFVRTAKAWGTAGAHDAGRHFPAFDEAIMGGLLLFGAAAGVRDQLRAGARNEPVRLRPRRCRAFPFLAAVALAAFENSRLNDFALWRNLETRLVEFCRASSCPAAVRSRALPAAPEKIEAAQ